MQEAGLTWQLGLISSTVYHMGAAVLPFRARLLAVLDSLFQAPSKARPRPSGMHGHAAAVCLAWTSAIDTLFPAHSKTRSRFLSGWLCTLLSSFVLAEGLLPIYTLC